MLQAFANKIVLQWGWRRAGIAFFAGAASAFAQAPFHLFPILWLTFPVLVWLVDGAVDSNKRGGLLRLRPAAIVGWWFGFGYFFSGLWWIGSAFLVEAEIFGWLMPVAVVALPSGLAIFWAIGIAFARRIWSDSPSRILVLALCLGLAEWARASVLTGFPWNSIGYGLAANTVQMQFAALVGLETMSLLAVLVFAAPAVLVANDPGHRRARIAVITSAVVVFATIVAYGAFRLSSARVEHHENVRLRIVQPVIAQKDKWKPENRIQVFNRYLELSERATSPDRLGMMSVTHLVWPESAFPFLLTENPQALIALSKLLPPGTVLITGAIRAEPAVGDEARRFFNSIYVIDHDGIIRDAYDKVRLVPFGEFLPLQWLFEAIGLQQLTRLKGGFSAGTRRAPLQIPGAPAATPLICYEIIFPSANEQRRNGWILNVTNDAWFGSSPGPYQHLHQTRLRAVEEGLAIVRAANTGISAVIDPYGRIVSKLDLNLSGIIDATLPKAINQPPVVNIRYYSLLGTSILLISIIVLARQKTYLGSRN